MHFFRFVSFAVVLTLCSCASTVETPKGTSKAYHSARFVTSKLSATPSSSRDLEDDPQVHAAVRSAITRQFDANGVPVMQGNADLIIAYMLLRQNSAATTMNSDYFGSGRNAMDILDEAHNRGVVKNTRPDYFLNGGILIDVLDARTNKLVFRNQAVRPVMEGVDAATRQSRIDSAVSQALAPFFK